MAEKKKRSPNIDSIVKSIEDRTEYNPQVIKRVLTTFIDEIPKLLVDNGSLVIMNLGVFTLRKRKNNINPKTQEILTKPTISLTFKQSKSVKQAIIREQGPAKDELLASIEEDCARMLEEAEKLKNAKPKRKKSTSSKLDKEK